MYGTMKLILLLSTFLLVNCITHTNGQFASPCPDIFQYLPAEATANTWSGEITIKPDVELSGVWMRIIFENAPTEVTTSFGEVVQRETNEYLVRRPGYKVSPSAPEKFKITVHYAGTAPELKGFRLNAKDACPAPASASVDAPPGFTSPCPFVFSYNPPGPEKDTWSGVLTLSSDAELTGIYSRISFDRSPLEVTGDFGDIVQRETSQYLIRKPGHKLAVGTALRINLVVKYNPAEPAPKLVAVQLNAKSICPTFAAPNPVTPAPLAKGLVSPCPAIFSYQNLDKEKGRWHGLILINTRVALSDWTLTILLDRPSLQLGVSDWNGYLRTQDNIEYQLTKPGSVINPGVFPIKFFIKYKPSRPIPKLSEIQLNKLNICPEDDQNLLNPIPAPVLSQYHTTVKPSVPSAPVIPVSSGEVEQCGTVGVTATPFITHGMETIPGQHPWHAALYHNKNVDLTYICGANLISKNYVLTVAHCATRQATGTALNPKFLVVVLGKYYLERHISQGIQDRMVHVVQDIIVHPNYDKQVFKNDIALLHLANPAYITDTVRPICLWQGDPDIKSVIGQEGTVVGWGWNERGQLSDQLIKTKMPIVDRLVCILSYPEFFAKFTNDFSYCAGFRNGSSACNGDSGGGMTISRTMGSRTIWYLRGLVSVGVALQNLDKCDSSHYVVFTDVAKYTDWIKQNTI